MSLSIENALDPMKALKEFTWPQHQKTEKNLPFFRENFDLDSYMETLKKFYGFYASVEPRLLDSDLVRKSGFDYEVRQKLHSLRQDLKHLGLSDSEIFALPKVQKFSVGDSLSERIGFLYVIEGSTLGGQFITKHLQKKLNLSPGAGASFFNSYGEMTPLRWKEFQGYARQNLLQKEDVEKSCSTALQCFYDLDSWLSTKVSF